MRVRDRIVKAARAVAAHESQVSIAEVARAAGVSWPTANRHLGGKTGLDALLGAHPKAADPTDSRARLLAAAARCVAQAGVDGAALEDVSTEAGVTKGSLYWHFDTKADLVRALVDAPEKGAVGARTLSALIDAHLARPEVEAALDVELAAAARRHDVRERLAKKRRATREEIMRELGLASEAEAVVVLALLDGLSVARRVDPDLAPSDVLSAARALLRRR